MKITWLTGSEPAPLVHTRKPCHDMASVLDTVMSASDEALSDALPKAHRLPCKPRHVDFRLYSIALFYHDIECDPYNHAGYLATYISHYYGKPTVHQYGWEQLVCWNGKDSVRADEARMEAGLRRYAMFLRRVEMANSHPRFLWEFCHNGQLPVYVS